MGDGLRKVVCMQRQVKGGKRDESEVNYTQMITL